VRLAPALPRGGVFGRFYVERIDDRHRDDTASAFRGCRWLLIFAEGAEARGFRTIADFQTYCAERWGVTKWSRDEQGDWAAEDGDSWIARDGTFWPGREANL